MGSDLVLMPGAMIALLREDGAVLLTERTDDGTWCLPGGGAEEGGSFARTAVTELAEEVGIRVSEADLTAFGSLSEAELHTNEYPGGDITHCYTLLFLARSWEGEPRPEEAEVTQTTFAPLDALPEPLHGPSAHSLALLRAYLESGSFQAR